MVNDLFSQLSWTHAVHLALLIVVCRIAYRWFWAIYYTCELNLTYFIIRKVTDAERKNDQNGPNH